MRTQVGIVGAGPAGLFLSHMLQRAGIDCVVLEARSRDYIEKRVRAGVLEQGTVDLIEELGLGSRMQRECMVDKALDIRFEQGIIHIDLPGLSGGKVVHIYGQQEVVKDLVAARLASADPLLFEAEVIALCDLDSATPSIRYRMDGEERELQCDLIAGCDGFHGVCRTAVPDGVLTTYDRLFPFGWLGILSESPPIREMTYCNHEHGFALFSRRSPHVSRLYIQCTPDEDLDLWPDARIWDELHLRLGDKDRSELVEGHIFQKGVTPVRSTVVTPMRYGALYLAGDAAHIVPPTGAKGLNLAVADVRVLARAMIDFFRTGSSGAARALLGHLPQASVEDRALFELHDEPAAPVSEPDAVRTPAAARRACLCARFEDRDRRDRGELCRPAVRGRLTCHDASGNLR